MRGLGALGLVLALAACDGAVECDLACGDQGTTVKRTFPSCSALRDEVDRRTATGNISQCEAEALESCVNANCGSVPL